MIKTPPYLTAEPEVREIQVQTGDHPDFMVMASDGLWDNISSEDAVTCVQKWLDKYQPLNFIGKQNARQHISDMIFRKGGKITDQRGFGTFDPNEDEDTYWDDNEKCMKWRVSPKHFIVEDENCGVHLIKNALGGKRRNLFCGVMSIQPPLSRKVRDDITVQVVFFGVDGSGAMEKVDNMHRS